MNSEEPQGAGGISRRRMIRRMGAGVAIAWTAPILTSVRVPAYAQVSPGCQLRASMDGAQEAPNPVPTPGTGTAVFSRTAPNQLSYTYDYQNLTSGVNAAHIHEAPPGIAGPVVIPLTINAGTTSGAVSDTATADPALLDRICANPGGFYINVHTQNFPGGEIRGQLQF
jgi:CHRD domain-containing protein